MTATDTASLAQPGDTYTNGDRIVHINGTEFSNEDIAVNISEDATVGETVTIPVNRYDSLRDALDTLIHVFDVDLPASEFSDFDALLVRDPDAEAQRHFHDPASLDHFVLDNEWMCLSESNILEHRVVYGVVTEEPRLTITS